MKFSIITICKNSEKYLQSTILSVLSQNISKIELEYILIDGNSSDNTLEIIKSFGNKITKLVSEPDQGIYDAMNKGIGLATGDIIGFLHSGDFYPEIDILAKVNDVFTTFQVDAVYGDLQYVYKEDVKKVFRNWKAGEYHLTKLKHGWMPPHPTFFVKKEIFNQFGIFDQNFSIAGDYDLLLRFIGKYKISLKYLPEILVKMRTGGASNQNLVNLFQKTKEDFIALKKNKIGNFSTIFLKNFRKLGQFL